MVPRLVPVLRPGFTISGQPLLLWLDALTWELPTSSHYIPVGYPLQDTQVCMEGFEKLSGSEQLFIETRSKVKEGKATPGPLD